MNTPRIFQVIHRTEEIPATVTLEIQPCDGTPLVPFKPGQFNMLYQFGSGEVPISFSGALHSGALQVCDRYIHTLRAVGKTTEALAKLRVGDQLGVRGPFGHGWPLDKLAGKHVLIVAGGLGMAPLRPLIEALLSQPEKYAGVQLFYGGKCPEELLFYRQLQSWREVIDVQLSADRADANWSGHIGVITQLLDAARPPIDNTVAVVCGPEIMMRFCIQTLQKLGLADADMYLSMERNMHCAIGHCGHCQRGPNFICKDGPVFCYEDIAPWFYRREL